MKPETEHHVADTGDYHWHSLCSVACAVRNAHFDVLTLYLCLQCSRILNRL